MKLQITSPSYRLRYMPEEDRILVSVDLSPDSELSMQITRRLVRNLLMALAKLVSDRAKTSTGSDPALRDTILDFQHSQSVANAVAEGHMRKVSRSKAPAVPPTLVRDLKIVPKPNGAIALVFGNSEQLLTVKVSADRVHMVIETFLQMAERAGWDFPPIAAWLESSKTTGAPADKTIN